MEPAPFLGGWVSDSGSLRHFVGGPAQERLAPHSKAHDAGRRRFRDPVDLDGLGPQGDVRSVVIAQDDLADVDAGANANYRAELRG